MHPSVKALITLAAICATGMVIAAGLPLVISMKTEAETYSLAAAFGCFVGMLLSLWALKDQWHQPMYEK